MKYDFLEMHTYQSKFVHYIKQKKKCGLFLGMGMGKTLITLSAIKDLFDKRKIKRVLIIAPLRVANTVWKQEASEWYHLKDLGIEICTGDAYETLKALYSHSQIHVINRERVPWLMETIQDKQLKWKWDMVVIDESSSFKNHNTKRFKALRKIIKHVRYTVLLTGTPSPNGYIDLWPQLFLLDQGERLERNITMYRNKYFDVDYMGYTYTLKEGSEDIIKGKISDICATMENDNEKRKVDINIKVELPKKVRVRYEELQEEFLTMLENGTNIEAPSAANVANKLLQISNGAVYDEDRNIHILHDEKINALKEIIEDNPNENLLIAYNYKHDLERLKKEFPKAVELSKSGKEIEKWNKGKIKMLLAHPASAGHGLNIQFGGHIVVWYGLNWSLELYQQFNARLNRQGQKDLVRIIHIISRNTIDEKVLNALSDKAKTQNKLLDYLKMK